MHDICSGHQEPACFLLAGICLKIPDSWHSAFCYLVPSTWFLVHRICFLTGTASWYIQLFSDTRYLLIDTLRLLPDTWLVLPIPENLFLIHGTCFLMLTTVSFLRYLRAVSCYMVSASWYYNCFLISATWFLIPGTCFLLPGTCFLLSCTRVLTTRH